MATDANTVTESKPAKAKTVIEDMDSRRMFANVEDAGNYLNLAGSTYADFTTHPQVLRGIITEGENAGQFDPAIYTADTRVMVAVLANRGEKDAKTGKAGPSSVKALVVTPVPTIDAILNDAAGRAWAEKILDKELNHVAVRALRNADDVESVADQMPLSLADYISSSRESTGGIMETFNTLFKPIIASLAAKSTQWAKARLIKTELKKAIESKAYALEIYPTLESRGLNPKTGEPLPSMFVMAAQLGIREATKQGLDPAIFTKWLDNRDAKVLTTKTDEDESDDFDLDDVAFVEPETKTEEPAESPAATVTE